MVDFPCLYARFDPAVALDADDPAYVDWQEEVGLSDVKQQLANCVRLTTTGYSHRLVTGLRGGGKTTELRRLKRALEEGPDKRYFVSFLDADDTLDLDDADPTDLVLAIVARLISDLGAGGIEVKVGKRLKSFFKAAQEILASVPEAGVDVTLTDPLGIAKLSTTLKRQPSVRKRVRDLLEGRNLDTLYDAINEEVLPPVRERLARDGYAGVLVVVDQLGRIPPEDQRHHRLFREGRGKLTALDCQVALLVHETRREPDEGTLDRFHELLHDQYVLTYRACEERWYDWSPLLGRSKLHASTP